MVASYLPLVKIMRGYTGKRQSRKNRIGIWIWRKIIFPVYSVLKKGSFYHFCKSKGVGLNGLLPIRASGPELESSKERIWFISFILGWFLVFLSVYIKNIHRLPSWNATRLRSANMPLRRRCLPFALAAYGDSIKMSLMVESVRIKTKRRLPEDPKWKVPEKIWEETAKEMKRIDFLGNRNRGHNCSVNRGNSAHRIQNGCPAYALKSFRLRQGLPTTPEASTGQVDGTRRRGKQVSGFRKAYWKSWNPNPALAGKSVEDPARGGETRAAIIVTNYWDVT